MATIIETAVFTYDELDAGAQERARDWFREGNDYFDEFQFDDFVTVCKILGVDLRTRPVKLMGGGTRYEPCIYYSGFSSQGDGACFEGSYAFSKGSAAKIKEYAPQDRELNRIASVLAEVQKRNFYQLTASMSHRGHYYHSGCMAVAVERDSATYQGMTDDAEGCVIQAMRDLADWMYRQIEAEHDYRNSDETVAEDIRANEYTFDEDGHRFG